jgi:hypothetical protein
MVEFDEEYSERVRKDYLTSLRPTHLRLLLAAGAQARALIGRHSRSQINSAINRISGCNELMRRRATSMEKAGEKNIQLRLEVNEVHLSTRTSAKLFHD